MTAKRKPKGKAKTTANAAAKSPDVLTPRQAAFVQEYQVDLNAMQAAIRAGYSPDTAESQGSRLLSNAKVRAALDVALAERGERVGVDAGEVVTGFAKIMRADVRKVLRWGEGLALKDALTGEDRAVNGVALINSADIDDDTAFAIAEVRQSRDGSLSVKMHPKPAAMVELARHLNLYRDRPCKVTLPPIETPADVGRAMGLIVDAMARGELTPAEAQAMSNVLETKRRALVTAELAELLERVGEGEAVGAEV